MNNKFIKNLTIKALSLSRHQKIIIAILLDSLICLFSTFIALTFRSGDLVYFEFQFLFPAIISIVIAIPVFFLLGLYRVIFRYISDDTVLILAKPVTFYTIIYSFIFTLVSVEGVPRSVGLMQPMIMFLLLTGSRSIVKNWFRRFFSIKAINYKKNIVIYGTGITARQLASNLKHSKDFKFLYFIDDNKDFWGGIIDNFLVKPVSSLHKLNKIDESIELWIAKPNLSNRKKRALIDKLKGLRLYIRTIPSLNDLTNHHFKLDDMRELNFNELIGREPIKPCISLLRKTILNKTVLVTGAGGSIGSELCRQILDNNPKHIILLEQSEIALYNIYNELNSFIKNTKKNNSVLIPLLVNVLDKKALELIFYTWKPYIVYHAAAYKHVPIVEQNIVSGIKNNFFSTMICANVSLRNNVKYFVLVSTDKAVRPTNIMGASKRLAEIGLQILDKENKKGSTCFSMVRFGNVLGSSGSVFPLFREQIKKGGPITLTHNKVTRYFMSITEAAQLVIQAGAMSDGGEVFILDMGKPIRIIDLARNMIESSGLQVKDHNTPWGDISIEVTGLRPGEKLYEELLIGKNSESTSHPRVFKANEDSISKRSFYSLYKKLDEYLHNYDIVKIQELLIKNIQGYRPNSTDVNFVSKLNKKK